MLLKKHTSRTFALSLALTAGMGEVILPQSLPEASAAEESVDNIYPSDTATEGSEKWGKLTCDDVMDEGFKTKLKELGDKHTYIPNSATPDSDYYEYPTEEELNNLEESSWDAPGDYTYLVEKYPENERPKLMKVKGQDKYFIKSVMTEHNPNIDEKYYYRLFKPEDYLAKEFVEWKEDSKFKKKYNSKIFTGYADLEDFSPYGGGENGNFVFRNTLKPELNPDKGLSMSERIDFFMKNDNIFSFDTSYYKDNDSLSESSRYFDKNPDTGEDMVFHNDHTFATCGLYVSTKPDSVDNMSSWGGLGAKDRLNIGNYLYPSDNGLTLRKTDESNKLLAGSSWKIKNLGTKEEFTVTDNEKPNDNDKNILEDLYKEDGLINVNLPEGRYELIETKAPEGYSIDDTPREFIIHDRTGASFGMGSIVNKSESSETPSESETPSDSTAPSTPNTPEDTITPSTSRKPNTKTNDNLTSTIKDEKEESTNTPVTTPTTPNKAKTPGNISTPTQGFTPINRSNPGTFNGGTSSTVEGEEINEGGKVDTGSPTTSIINKIRTIF